jgi:peptidoglycan hydrolase-like protein with peptidoglycan-binding domain
MMKRTLFVLGLSAMLAMPVLASAQQRPSTPGTGGEPGVSGSGPISRTEQEHQRGQPDMQQSDIRQAQRRLQEAGFDPGPIDGQLGARTKEALREYQKAHGLPQTGQLDESTRDSLMAQKGQESPGGLQSPGGSMRQGTTPGPSVPGGRSSDEPRPGSTIPGGSSSSR